MKIWYAFTLLTLFHLLACESSHRMVNQDDNKTISSSIDKQARTQAGEYRLTNSEDDQLSQAMEQIADEIVSQKLGAEKLKVFVDLDTSDISENSGKNAAYLKFRRQGKLDISTKLVIKIDSQSDVSHKDYKIEELTVKFASGELEKKVKISAIDDKVSEYTEHLFLNIGAPGYVDLSKDSFILRIKDNEPKEIPTNFVADIRPNEEGDELEDYGPHSIKIRKLRGTHTKEGSSPKAIKFDGKQDAYFLPGHPELNHNGPFEAKTIVISFSTSDDIERRQLIYKQGGRYRGINAYIQGSRLFVGAYNLRDEDQGQRTPWGPSHQIAGISPNTHYVIVLEINAQSRELNAWLNDLRMGSSTTAGPLFSDRTSISFGGIKGSTVLNTGIVNRNTDFFSGSLSRFIAYNSLLTAEERRNIFLKLKQSDRNQVSIVRNVVKLSEADAQGINLIFRLDQALNEDLKLDYQISGNASENSDFSPLGSITIPKHSISHLINIKALPDESIEFVERAQITFRNKENVPVSNSVHLEIIDPKNLATATPPVAWVSFDKKITNHDVYGNRIIPDSINTEDMIGSIEDSKHINSALHYYEKSIALSFETLDNIDDRQIIFKQGNNKTGINIYVDRGNLFLLTYNLIKQRGVEAWGKHFLSVKATPNTKYRLVFGINTRRRTLKAYINENFIENTQAELGAIPQHKGSIDFGGASHSVHFHDSITINRGARFQGKIFEAILFNSYLKGDDLERTKAYLYEKYGQKSQSNNL